MAAAAPGPNDDIKFGRFSSEACEKLGIAKTEYLYTTRKRITEAQINLMLDIWELDRPNLIISPVGPWKPGFVESEMFTQTALGPIVNEVQRSMQLVSKQQTSATPTPQDSKVIVQEDADLRRALGQSLENKLVNCIKALLSACYQTNSWILIELGASAFLPMVERAVEQTHHKPIILVVESLEENETTSFCHKDQIQAEAWKMLREGAQQLNPGADVETINANRLPKNLWRNSPDEPLLKENAKDIREEPYGRFPCRFATHAIFTKTWQPFEWSLLAPKGTVYVAGGPVNSELIVQRLAKFEPSVLFMHTGAATDFVSNAIEIVVKEGVYEVDGVLKLMQERYPFWSRMTTTYSGEKDAIYGGVSRSDAYGIVKQVIDSYQINRNKFESMAVVLDVWHAKPHEVLERLSKCFASCSSNSQSEVGAEGTKERSIVMAWRLYDTMSNNCKIFGRRADTMSILGTVLSVSTTALSVFVTFVESHPEQTWTEQIVSKQAWTYHHQALIVLPAVAGLIVTALSRLRYVSKWATMHLAKTQIESEIWQFRTDSGAYRPHQPSQADAGSKKKNKKDAGEPQKAVPMRKVFTQRVTAIYSHVLDGSMHQDGFELQTAKDGFEVRAQKALEVKSPGKRNEITPLLVEERRTQEKETLLEVEGAADDLVNNLTGEDYFRVRVNSIQKDFRKAAPRLACRLLIYEILLLFTTLTSTLLAALNYKEWIPLAVAISAMLTSFLTYEALQGRLAALNAAISDITALEGTWASLGVVERRTDSVKNLMVQVVEGAVMREASAYVAGNAQIMQMNTSGSNDEEDAKSKSKKS